MNTYGGVDGGEWLTSCFSSFTPGERARGTHWIGGCNLRKLQCEDVDWIHLAHRVQWRSLVDTVVNLRVP
jgi:hypothetical protein